MRLREAPRLKLIGPPMAPPVELARWLLESRDRAVDFRPRAAGLHAWASIRRKVPVELPLLLSPEGATGGLLDSIDALEERLAPRETLFPRAGDRAFVAGLCGGLFGPAVRSFYFHMLPQRSVLARRASAAVPLLDALVVRLAYPAWAGLMRKGLKLTGFDAVAMAAQIDVAFARVEAELGTADFLGGTAPDIRDVVFAVLASPVILPPGHPASIPGLEELPAPFREQVEAWRARPAGRLALRVYEQRPKAREGGVVPADRPRLLQRLLTPPVIRIGFRLAAACAPRVLKVGQAAFVPRWADVQEVLSRDGDFLIAPVNRERIEGVMGPFILGMDGSPALADQRRALYSALRTVDHAGAERLVVSEAERLAAAAQARFGRIDVVGGYARPVAARAAVALFGVAGPGEADLMRAARAVFHESFLNLGDDPKVRAAGRSAGAEIARWIEAEIERRGGPDGSGDLVDRLLEQVRAGALPAEQVPWITAGLLVGAIDTTATAVAHIVTEAARNPWLAAAMARDADDPRRLTGWCWEALRRRPHNPLVIRQAASDVTLAGATVAKGTRVWALTLAAMQDARVFSDPSRLDPARPPDLYLHFGGGLHRCSGHELNARHIPALVAPLLRRGVRAPYDLRFRGPFPDRLVVQLERS